MDQHLDPESQLIVVNAIRDVVLLMSMMEPDLRLLARIAERLARALNDIARNDNAPA